MGIDKIKEKVKELLKDEREFLSEDEYKEAFDEEYNELLKTSTLYDLGIKPLKNLNTIYLNDKNTVSIELKENIMYEDFYNCAGEFKTVATGIKPTISIELTSDSEILEPLKESYYRIGDESVLDFELISHTSEHLSFKGIVLNIDRNMDGLFSIEIQPVGR